MKEILLWREKNIILGISENFSSNESGQAEMAA
jgi:hypothetical protein